MILFAEVHVSAQTEIWLGLHVEFISLSVRPVSSNRAGTVSNQDQILAVLKLFVQETGLPFQPGLACPSAEETHPFSFDYRFQIILAIPFS